MGKLKELSVYVDEIHQEFSAIGKKVVIEESAELNTYLRDLTPSENYLMALVIPAFGNNSPKSADEFRNKGFTQLIIVEKTDASADSQDGYIDSFDNTLIVAMDVQAKILKDSLEGCEVMRHLDPKSLQIVPFNRSQLKGWNIIFTFDVL